MKTDVIMPKMGESLQEGTILRWLKKVGDKVERDEMILEISTDKVDTEVPSPAAGVIVEILAEENQTVPVGTVIARIETNVDAVSIQTEKNIQRDETKEETPKIEQSSQPPTDGNIIEVVMPKMGESLQEGTILRWLKKVGDRVERDEMILEISTDKVDTEVPSPAAGVIIEILAGENQTVPVGTVIAKIQPADYIQSKFTPKEESKTETSQSPSVEVKEPTKVSKSKRFYSPVVKTIAQEEGISEEELEQIEGTGIDGRVTKNDILKYIENKKATKEKTPKPAPVLEETTQKSVQTPQPQLTHKIEPTPTFGQDVEIIPMDRVRQLIAQHMIYSKQTSAHVTSIHEADVTGIVRFREKQKEKFQNTEGFKLTLTPFFAKAAIDAIKKYPRVNVSVDGTNIIQHKRIHLAIATALEDGNLIVPVIKNADSLSISGLARSIYDLASRARSKKLNPDEIQGGTFTLTNIGSFGTLFGTPIINQPQTAILGTGIVQKRPIVKTIENEDIILIRHMIYLSLTYDHRVIDGMLAGLYLSELVRILESMNENNLSL